MRKKHLIAQQMLRRANLINGSHEAQFYILQGYWHGGETAIMIRDDDTPTSITPPRIPTLEELKGFVDIEEKACTQHFDAITDFEIGQGDKTIDEALVDITSESKLVFDTDTSRVNTDSTTVNNGAIAAANKTALETIANTFNFQTKQRPKPTGYTLEMKQANVYHDLLDCISYWCRRINPDNGDTVLMTVGALVEKCQEHFAASEVYIYNSHIDMPDMISLMLGADEELRRATTFANLEAVADTIDSALPKLPLIRRNWAITPSVIDIRSG